VLGQVVPPLLPVPCLDQRKSLELFDNSYLVLHDRILEAQLLVFQYLFRGH
jgi:hypothetical protein